MRPHWTLVAVLFAMVAGCAPARPDFRARWYARSDGIYVAILNQSMRDLTVERLVLNPTTEGPEAQWSVAVNKTLVPGQLLVLPLKRFESANATSARDWRCHVPTTVTVAVGRSHGGSSMPVEVDGVLPNLLPKDWESACGPAGR